MFNQCVTWTCSLGPKQGEHSQKFLYHDIIHCEKVFFNHDISYINIFVHNRSASVGIYVMTRP